MRDTRISHSSQLCDVVSYKRDGKERGRYLDVHNGSLSFTVCLDKCMDISYFRHRGQNISFVSPNGICSEGSFDQTFCGGMLYTCGLESLGNRQGLPMHGSVHNTAATVKSIVCNEREICIEGIIRDARLFGGNVLLERKIYCEYMSDSVVITDVLTNDGFTDVQYALLYHMNLGYPFLEEGVTVYIPSSRSRGRDEFAKSRLSDCNLITNPVDLQEQVFFHDVKHGHVEVINDKQSKAVVFDYGKDNLPCLVQWKSMVAGNYALGIEPSTCFLDEEFAYQTLKVGEAKAFSVTISVKHLT